MKYLQGTAYITVMQNKI